MLDMCSDEFGTRQTGMAGVLLYTFFYNAHPVRRQELHAFLLDNYFIMTRDEEGGKHVVVSRVSYSAKNVLEAHTDVADTSRFPQLGLRGWCPREAVRLPRARSPARQICKVSFLAHIGGRQRKADENPAMILIAKDPDGSCIPSPYPRVRVRSDTHILFALREHSGVRNSSHTDVSTSSQSAR